MNHDARLLEISDVINEIARGHCTDDDHFIKFYEEGQLHAWSLRDIDLKASKVAARLSSLGICRGDAIGIMATNSIEWIVLDLAILKVGGKTAGFEPGRYSHLEIIQEYGLKLLFVDEAHSSETIKALSLLKTWFQDDTELPGLPFHEGYQQDESCAIKFTSGSTGRPKGLEATVGSINNSIAVAQQLFGHGDGDNLLVFLRLSLLQQRYWIYSAFHHHHDVTIADMDSVWRVASIAACTVIMAVPGFYEALKSKVEEMAFHPHNPSTLRERLASLIGPDVRYLWTGSAPARRSLLEFFEKTGVPLFEGYGLNETCIVSKNCPGAYRLGSVGKIVPNKSVRFDENGILIVQSRFPVNDHYRWCEPGISERTFISSTEVRTFDTGYVDEDGYLFILGRMDDIIVLENGRNVNAKIIEDLLKQSLMIHECVLYGNGMPCLCAIVSVAEVGVDNAALMNFIEGVNATLLPEQRLPHIIVAREPFSVLNGLLTSQYKVKRAAVIELYKTDIHALYHLPAPVHADLPLPV